MSADDALDHLDAAIAALDGKLYAPCHGLWVRCTPVKGSATLVKATCPECGQRFERNTDWPPTVG